MKKLFLIVILLFSSFAIADSRYDDTLYGLSESEKSVMENRALALENQKTLRMHSLKFGQIQENLEGLRSVVDSLGNKLGRTSQKLSSRVDSEDINSLQTQIDEMKDSNDEKYRQIDAMLRKLTQMIARISSPSGSSKEYANIKEEDTQEEVEAKPIKEVLTNGDRFKRAVKLYRSKQFQKSKKDFEILADKNYKPAKMNYYLGEVSYYTKHYSDAIVFYKKSVGYYDSASYMPTLLLHTALSFEKLGDSDNSSKFFDTIISTYPETEQAKIAQRHLY